MGLLQKIQAKTEEARAKEKIRPLLESRMMRDILLEIGQRGNEALDPQSVPLAMRRRATHLPSEAAERLKQCAVMNCIWTKRESRWSARGSTRHFCTQTITMKTLRIPTAARCGRIPGAAHARLL
mgnify:CR=1 FL=1